MHRLLFLGSIAALFAVQTYLRFQSDIIQDCAWFLYVAEQLLNGKALYTDIIEVNPPLGMWLVVPIVWAAKQLAINSVAATYTTLLLASVGTLGLCNRYLRKSSDLNPLARMAFIFCLALCLLFFPAAFFAEREHFIVMLFLPWLFLRLIPNQQTQVVPTWERLFVGVLASIAICIKPQSIAAPILVELVLFLRSRRPTTPIAPENLSAIATALIYVLAVVIFTPKFLSEMLALGAKAYVPFYGYPAYIIALNARWTVIALLIATVIRLRLKALNTDTRLADVLFAAAIGFTVSYFVQMKGFTYQIMPANMLSWLACAAGAAMLWQTERKMSVHIAAAIGIGALVLGDVPQTYVNTYPTVSRLLANNAPNAKSIFIASTRLDDGFPFVQKHNLSWASRLPTQWLAPYVASKWQSGALPQDELIAKTLDWTITDLITLKPDIIMIDQSHDQAYVPGGKFDYVKFWQNDPRFQNFWAQYEYRETARELAVYTLLPK